MPDSATRLSRSATAPYASGATACSLPCVASCSLLSLIPSSIVSRVRHSYAQRKVGNRRGGQVHRIRHEHDYLAPSRNRSTSAVSE